MHLSRYLDLWKDTLSGAGPTNSIAAELEMPVERLQMYRGFVQWHYSNALQKMYPRLAKVAPQLFTPESVGEYYRAFEPTAWELNDLTKHLCEHLKSQPHVPPYLAELADYEWAEFCVFVHPSNEERVARELEPHQLALSPALYLMQFQHLITDWKEKIDAGEIDSKPEEGTQVLIVSRLRNPFKNAFSIPSFCALAILQTLSAEPLDREECIARVMALTQLNEEDVREEVDALLAAPILITNAEN